MEQNLLKKFQGKTAQLFCGTDLDTSYPVEGLFQINEKSHYLRSLYIKTSIATFWQQVLPHFKMYRWLWGEHFFLNATSIKVTCSVDACIHVYWTKELSFQKNVIKLTLLYRIYISVQRV